MEANDKLNGLKGGIGAYPGTSSHGPFVHIDYRGDKPARWIKDQRGRKVQNISAFLKKNQYAIRIPTRKYNYVSPSRYSARTGGGTISASSIKASIQGLEKEVLAMEKRWENIQAGPKPLTSSDLYIAADVANESMLLNRGRVIIKRMEIKDSALDRRRPAGIARIYQMPKGILQVRAKSVEPIWFHPEWSFIGGNLPVKAARLRHSFFAGSGPGKTIDLGAGTKIHPSTLPGNTVLPGCIGVSDKDINAIHKHAVVGTRVYLYEGAAYIPGVKLDLKKKKDLMALQSFLILRRRAADLDKPYLVLDLNRKRGWVKKGESVLRELNVRVVGPCFSKAFPNAAKHFKMPRGTMFVQSRDSFPEWYKPDWMFVKQGRKIPEPMGPGRIQRGLLGPYAFYLGSGLVIHGRHNSLIPNNAIDYVAIELPDKDLKYLWNTIPEGGVVILQ